MRIAAAIFARGGSQGIPRKNIRELGGKPLIAWAIETARQCPSIGRVLVSTDDTEIADVAKQTGAEVPFLRPAELATSTAPRWAAWQHLVTFLEDKGEPVDVMVDLQTTSPIRRVEDVERCISVVRDTPGLDGALTIFEADRNPYFNMVELDAQNCMRISKPSPQRISNRQQAPKVYALSTVCYAVRASFAKQGVHLFDGRMAGIPIPREWALDIDTELDWQFAEFLVSKKL